MSNMKFNTTDDSQRPRPHSNRVSIIYRKAYTSLGFQKSYNFLLFSIFAGAMLGFSLARLKLLNLDGIFAKSLSPGEWYWLRSNHYRIGIALHLGCILPAGILMIWQFIPRIRQITFFHRINGYLVILLILISNVGALMIVRRSFGGELATQGCVGVLVIVSTVGLVMAYINIKRKQIDQHRAWMLRTMFYCGSIITTRLIMVSAAIITTAIGSYYALYTCDELNFIHNSNSSYVESNYPACSTRPSNSAAIHADFGSTQPENIGAALRLPFGMSLWLAFFLHAVGVEIYLNMTPREAQRLRQVSYERQLEAGYEKPGSGGLVVENWGDAEEWRPGLPIDRVFLAG